MNVATFYLPPPSPPQQGWRTGCLVSRARTSSFVCKVHPGFLNTESENRMSWVEVFSAKGRSVCICSFFVLVWKLLFLS